MEAALRVALDRHGMSVESAATASVVEAVTAAAPDLVVLIGDAVIDGGAPVLRHLAENPTTSVVPVALLSNDTSLDQRLRAFRSGAVAVVQRGASADAIARQVAQLARELPERSGQSTGELGEATLDELLALVSKELRSGILSVEPQGRRNESDPVRVVLGAGGPVAAALKEFVQRLKPLIAKAEPLRYELLEESGGRLRLFDDGDENATADLELLRHLRVLLMDNDPGRADVLAQALRDHGSLVGVTDVSVGGLDRARSLDPEVVILDSSAIEGPGFEAVRTLRRDPRLRWASLLVARWDELWPRGAATPDLEQLAGRIAPLTEHDRTLRARATAEPHFDTRLELTGPSRLLRTLVRLPGTRHVTIRGARATIEVDVADGLVVGAQGTSQVDEPRPIEGMAALAGLLNLSAGRVRVEGRGHPSAANVMLPVDEALDRAAREESPVKASVLPPNKRAASKIDPPGAYGPAASLRKRSPSPSAGVAPAGSERARKPSNPFPSVEALRTAPAPPPASEEHDDESPIDESDLAMTMLHPSATSVDGSSKPAKTSDLRWEESSGDRKLGRDGASFPAKPRSGALPAPPLAGNGASARSNHRYVPPPPPASRRPMGGLPSGPPKPVVRTLSQTAPARPAAPRPPASSRPIPEPPAETTPPRAARKRTIVGVAPPVELSGTTYGPAARLDAERGPTQGPPKGPLSQPAPRKRASTLLGAGIIGEGPSSARPERGGLPELPPIPGEERTIPDAPPALGFDDLPPLPEDRAGEGSQLSADSLFGDLEQATASEGTRDDPTAAMPLEPMELPELPSDEIALDPPTDGGLGAARSSAPGLHLGATDRAEHTEKVGIDPTRPVPLRRDITDLSDGQLPAGSLPPTAITSMIPPPRASRTPRRIAYVAAGMVAAAVVGGALAAATKPNEHTAHAIAPTAPSTARPASPRAEAPREEASSAGAPATEAAPAEAQAAGAPATGAAPSEATPTEASPNPPPTGAPPAEAPPAEAPPAEAQAAELPPPDLQDVAGITPDSALPRDRARASDILVEDADRLAEAGLQDLAERALGHALELDRRNPQAFEALARLHLARRDYDEAIHYAEEAVRVRRRRAEYYLLLGDCLLAAGRRDEARDAWTRGLHVQNIRPLRERLEANGGL
jgi:CheY-like chemotaxis protein